MGARVLAALHLASAALTLLARQRADTKLI